jgi:hypothetical protein
MKNTHRLLCLTLCLLCVSPMLMGMTQVPLSIHIATKNDKPVSKQAWIDEFVATANRLFKPADIFFKINKTSTFSKPGSIIKEVAQRHALARYAEKDGSIHLFVVERLADKAIKDKWISGVHWRYQGKDKQYRGRRYIILSRWAARIDTPAHELGHFFGQAHAKLPDNLMKSLPRDDDAKFSKWQIGKIKKQLRKMMQSKLLKTTQVEYDRRQLTVTE